MDKHLPKPELTGDAMSTSSQRAYCVYNKTREAFLSLSVARADTPFTRLKGLLGKLRMRSDEGLWVAPSRGVHTMGLLFSVDLVFLDADFRVLHLVEHLRPFRLGPLRLRSDTVLQLPAHTIYASGTMVGDELLVCPARDIGNYIADKTAFAQTEPQPPSEREKTVATEGLMRSSELGTAMIEFALLLPVLLLLMLNAVNFCTYLFDWITINNAARAAAEYQTYNGAAVGLQSIPSYAQVLALVTTEVSALQNSGSVTVGICTNNSSTGVSSYSCSGTGGVHPAPDPEPTHFVVTDVSISYTYQPIVGVFQLPVINLSLTLPPVTITREILMRNMQ